MSTGTSSARAAPAAKSGIHGLGLALAVYLAIPNLAIFILGRFVYLVRPAINLDYLLIGALGGLLTLRLSIVAYAVVFLIDLFVTLAPVFHFDLADAAAATEFVLKLHLAAAAPIGILVVGTAAVFSTLAVRLSFPRGGRSVSLALLVVAASLFGLDSVNGTSHLSRTQVAHIPINFATSGAYRLFQALNESMVLASRPDGKLPLIHMEGATGRLQSNFQDTAALGSFRHENFVLVIVESLGHFRDGRGDSVVLAPVFSASIANRYRITSGLLATHGSTTDGEIRELCGLVGNYRTVSRLDLANCLPNKLRDAGYRTSAFHGYTGSFFERYQWYPRIGFEAISFAEEISRDRQVSYCGTLFRGICDKDVAQLVRAELVHPTRRPHFVYWLTLNSHLPVDAKSAPDTSFDCSMLGTDNQTKDICALTRIQYGVIEAVAQMATDSTLKATTFVLVGDHPPPYLSRLDRSMFAEDSVPFVELEPRY